MRKFEWSIKGKAFGGQTGFPRRVVQGTKNGLTDNNKPNRQGGLMSKVCLEARGERKQTDFHTGDTPTVKR